MYFTSSLVVRTALLALAVLYLALFSREASAFTAEELANLCEGDDVKQAVCLGYVLGAHETYVVTNSSSNCADGTSRNGDDLKKIFVDYLQNNSGEKKTVASKVLYKAWSC
jgi:hypothetical protein